MIAVHIPGFRELELHHLVLDYNGTLATEGKLLPPVAAALNGLATTLEIHVVTADTFGLAEGQLAGLPVQLIITPEAGQAEAKLAFVTSLTAATVVAIGNGRNDQKKRLKAAALGIALIQREGVAVEALVSADVAALNILDALELLQNPKRLIATLRA